MKKISILAVILAILLTFSTVAMAEENALTLSDAHVREDETIYLTLRLNKSIIGDAVGISYAFDSAVLEPVLSSCTWSQKGTLSNFNKEYAGVWAASKAKDLSGDICVLAFRVKDDVKLTETTVSCTLVIKNGADEQGTFTAQATVTYACDHSYGLWEPNNEAGHIKSCVHCGSTAYQPHSWNTPKNEENPDDPDHDWMVYDCQVCGFVYREEVAEIEEVTEPSQTTEPVTEPTATVTDPPRPPETQPVPSVPSTSAPNNPGNPDTKEPVKQTDPTLPPQETLPRDPETQPNVPTQETRPAFTEDDKDNDSVSGENDEPTEKEDVADPVPETSQPSEAPKDPTENTEATNPSRPQDEETEPTVQPEDEDPEDEDPAPDTQPKDDDPEPDTQPKDDDPKPGTQPRDDATEPTTRPTYPDNSSNATPQTEPTVETTAPPATTAPTLPYNDYNTAPPQTTTPPVVPVKTEPTAQDTVPSTHDHEHDHATEPVAVEEEGNPVVNALMIAAVLIAAVGGASLYLKKKRN